MKRPATGGVIFDLDDTLFDCSGLLTDPARHRAARVLAREAEKLSETQAVKLQTQWSRELGSTEAIRKIARTHSLPESALTEALSTYNTPDVPPIDPFPDAIPVLCALADSGLALTLVTSGVPERQLAKIDRLGLDRIFSKDIGNLYLHDPSAGAPRKDPYLQQAARWMDLPHDRVAVVGDKLESEIEAGNRLGMTTIWARSGHQHPSSPGSPEQTPDHEINSLSELTALLP